MTENMTEKENRKQGLKSVLTAIPSWYRFLTMNTNQNIIARFRSHADSVTALVVRCASKPGFFDVSLRDDRGGVLQRIAALPLRDAINRARCLTN